MEINKTPKTWLDYLSDDDLAFVKRFVLASGSLKELAGVYGISYPTVRLRLDRLIAKIQVVEDQQVTSPFEKLLRAQYADVLRNEGTTVAVLGARHPDSKIIQEQAKQYRRLITDELKRIAAAARNDFERAKASEDQLAASLDDLKRTAIVSNEAMVRLRELERVAESNRAVYEAFLNRAKELGEQGSVDTSSTRVIAVAVPPNKPTTPRGTLVLLGLLAGLGLGTVFVVLRTRNRSFA